MQLTGRFQLIALSAVLLGLGFVGVAAYQDYREDLPRVAEAIPIWDGPIEDDDLEDGGGISHSSRVKYNRQYDPFKATVTRVQYGGRPPDYFWYEDEQWKHNFTHYYRWDGSSWQLRDLVGEHYWRSTGSSGDLDYHNLNWTVVLRDGARVDDGLRYKAEHIITGMELDFSAPANRHYLE